VSSKTAYHWSIININNATFEIDKIKKRKSKIDNRKWIQQVKENKQKSKTTERQKSQEGPAWRKERRMKCFREILQLSFKNYLLKCSSKFS